MLRIRDLSQKYVQAVDRGNLSAIGALFAEDFMLEDPAGRFCGKQAVLDYMAGLLDGAEVKFRASNIFTDQAAGVSVIEFDLTLGGKRLVGTDVIRWGDGKMCELRAYLYEKGTM